MSEVVRITDVSPRDGLQNEAGVIPSADKARLVELLCASGVDEVEVTSFVSPKWVPQLGDAREVCIDLVRRLAGRVGGPYPMFSALVPNLRGLESLRALEQESPGAVPIIKKISVFTAASETFSQKNTNASITETFGRFRELLGVKRSQTAVRGYVSCVVACPFEGPIAPAAVADVCERLIELGVTELDLGDTIGAGTPESIKCLLEVVVSRIGRGWFDRRAMTLHLHDTFGRAAACVESALALGVRSFDGSVAGLGGCPYASRPGARAPGNIDTKVLVETIHRAGFQTRVDLGRLSEAAAFARLVVGKARAGA